MVKHRVQKDYKVGIYVRLSNEDSRAGESVSVENQKLMLIKHVEEMGWKLREVYVDDGFSGTNQNRPAFQRMMVDVKEGFIYTILIKDLSRLGRNYLEVGNLAEVFLPEHGCELISLSEPMDEMMVFRNWFNEQHSKTTSRKVRAAKRISAENGKYLGTYAPYGYKKDPANRHKLVIDEMVAHIVRSIFEMRAGGMGFRAIACKLNEDGVLPPKDYYYRSINRKNPFKSNGLWNDTSIKVIIDNETYIGNVVQGKFGTISYKNSKAVRKPEEDWIRAEGQHEPLIERELWDRVQSFSRKNHNPRRRKDGETNLFTGLLRCATCNSAMRASTERGKRKDGSEYKYTSYMCSNYATSGKIACTAHIIYENALSQLVIDHIRAQAQMIELNEERIVQAILKAQSNESISCQVAYKNELGAHQKQIAKLDLLIESLYEDRANGIVSDDLFRRQVQKYEQERATRLNSVDVLERRIKNIKHDVGNATNWTNLIRQHKSLEVLDSETLTLLIDKITVSEVQVVNGRRIRDIQVIYNFVGDIERLKPQEKVVVAV